MKSCVVLCILCLAGCSFAQTPLTLDEALRLARENNLLLKKQQQVQNSADLEVRIRQGQRLPSLNVLAVTSVRDEIAEFDLPFAIPGSPVRQIELGSRDQSTFSLSLTQPVFTGARLATRVKLARNASALADIQKRVLAQQISYQIHLLFFKSQQLLRAEQTRRASQKRLRVQLAQTRDLFFAAQLMAFDTLRVFNQLLQLEIQLEQNARDQRLALLQMAALLDLEEPRPVAAIDLAAPVAFALRLDSLRQVAFAHRPELGAAKLGQLATRLQKRLARSAFLPAVNAEVKYTFAKPGLNQVANEWMDFFSAGVQLRWNLWRADQDRHRVQQAVLAAERQKIEERDLRNAIALEVEKSWENARFASRQIRLAQQLLSQQQERFRIVSEQLKNGVATTNDLLVAEADLTAAELQVQNAVIGYHINLAGLAKATGTLTP